MGLSIFDENIVLTRNLNCGNAQGTTANTLLAATDGGKRVDGILATSTDVVDHDFQIYVQVAGSNVLLGVFTVPTLAGTSGVPTFDVMAHLVAPLQSGFNLPATGVILMQALVAVTATKLVQFYLFGGSF